jgi:hypothetical protein
MLDHSQAMTDVHLAGPTASEELRCMFVEACARPTSIHQHLSVMRDTASGCQHITEFGVGCGDSTLAWLLVQPDKLVCYDLGFQDCVPTFERICGRTDFRFYAADARIVEIEETDLLFIDTIHTYSHLKEELRVHGGKARKYIICHDTTTFGEVGEDRQAPGLFQAILEFVRDNPQWKIKDRFTHNNGLTILGTV